MATYYNVAHSFTDIRQAKLYTKDEVLSSPYYSPKGRGFTVFDGTSDKYPFCSTLDIEGLKKVGVYNTQNNETVYIYEGIPITTIGDPIETFTTNLATAKFYNNSHGLGYFVQALAGAGERGSSGQSGSTGDYYQGAGNTFSGTGGSGGAGGLNGRTVTVKLEDKTIVAGGGYGGGGGGGGAGGASGSSSGTEPEKGGLGGIGGRGSLGENRWVYVYKDLTINSISFTTPDKGEDGSPGNGIKPSSLYSGRGGQSGSGQAGSPGSSGSGKNGGWGGAGEGNFPGSGGDDVNFYNGTRAEVSVSKIIVYGIL